MPVQFQRPDPVLTVNDARHVAANVYDGRQLSRDMSSRRDWTQPFAFTLRELEYARDLKRVLMTRGLETPLLQRFQNVVLENAVGDDCRGLGYKPSSD